MNNNDVSLRDYFAATALSSVMGTGQSLGSLSKSERQGMLNEVAEIMYEMADAMLKARKEDSP